MSTPPLEPIVVGNDRARLVLDPRDFSGHLSLVGEAGTGWTFAPLGHLRVSDASGEPAAWNVVAVSRIAHGEGGLEMTIATLGNTYRASVWLERESDEVVFALEPVTEPERIGSIHFPGPLLPGDGPVTRLALPRMRTNGLVHEPAAADHWTHQMNVASHSGLNMPFWGLGAAGQGVLAVLETPDDAELTIEKSIRKPLEVSPTWTSSLGKLRYRRELRCRMVSEDSYVVIAKAYRQYVMSRGRFKSLAEKIEERPIVQQVIGGPYFSLGYLPFSERKFRQVVHGLREIGYTNGIIGPIDHIQWSSGAWLNDYQPFIHAPHFAGIAAESGFAAFAWLYLEDILRWDEYFDPAWLLKRENGDAVEGWFNRDYEYRHLCTRVLLEQHRRLRDRMTEFEALHFDTTTAKDLAECWDPAHPMSKSDDREARRARLKEVAGWNILVGSEAGYDWAFDVYDFCSSNPRAALETGMPVPFDHAPLLGLVYHDAIVSYCWEYDPYNPSYLSGDWSREKVLFDAMAGNPPTVAPVFGYFPVIRRPAPPVESRWVMWEDPATQRLLREALPIAQLHGRTAHMEMIDHARIDDAGSATRTVYADGTTVLVNFGPEAVDPGAGKTLPAGSYRIE